MNGKGMGIRGRGPGLRVVFVLAGGMLPLTPAWAEDSPQLPRVASPFNVVAAEGDGVTQLAFSPRDDRYASLDGPFVLEGFPVTSENRADLLVSRVELFTPDAKILIGSAGGERAMALPGLTLLSGHILGEPASRVYLSLSDEAQFGYVIREGRTYILSTGPAGQNMPPVIFDPAELPEGSIDWKGFDCLTDSSAFSGIEFEDTDEGDAEFVYGARCRVAILAVDTDWEYTGQIFGGDAVRSAEYAATLWGAVNEIYTRDVNARIRLSFLRVWDADVDPYAGGGLGEFQNYWNANMGHVPRHAAHILSSMYGGGVAYLPGLCNWGYEYGLSGALGGYFPYPLRDHHYQNWDPFVVSHELGHNFGAPHTHDHVPPIDGCGLGDCTLRRSGTIMSYCHGCTGGMSNIILGFHERTLTEAILPYLDRGVGCDLLSDAECDVQCGDIRKIRAKCGANGTVTAKVLLWSDAHHAQNIIVSFNGLPITVQIVNDRAIEKICCYHSNVTVALEEPAGCQSPLVVTCD